VDVQLPRVFVPQILQTPGESMTLEEIKHIAINHPEQIEICWDKIDSDPKYKQDFEDIVTKSLTMLPMIESIYLKLVAGESVAFEGESTSLDPADIQEYKDIVEDELFSGYQMLDMYSRYLAVQNVINT
jgi:hypothetical protein